MVLTYRTQIETHRHVGLPVASLAGSSNDEARMGWLFSGREADRKKTQRRRWKRRTKVSETGKEWNGLVL